MSTFLDDLLADTRARVAAARRALPLAELERLVAASERVRPSFVTALSAPGVSVIAEVKRASPSRGDLAPGMDAVDQASAYRSAGVGAISVLTEPSRFKGSLDDLDAVSTLGTPTLRKDFVVDASMLHEAVLAGASAALLIVAALTDAHLAELHAVATDLGLDTLVEVHDEAELERAMALDPAVVGVNARDLRTFDVDRGAFARLRPAIPDGVLAVDESGIRTPDDVRRAGETGAHAVLVGEALVTAADPAGLARGLVDAGRVGTGPSGSA